MIEQNSSENRSEGGAVDGKEALRERLRERRRHLPEEVRRSASREVVRRLEEWRPGRGEAVAGYLSFDCEVDVSSFLEDCLASGERVALPRVEDDETIEYVDVESLDDVEEGAFGILEPLGSPCELAELEFFLVPGVGFDRSGARLGMGWGYYDRMLSERRRIDSASDALFIGICYDCQLLDDSLPTEPHDVSMDAVVTQHEILYGSGRIASD